MATATVTHRPKELFWINKDATSAGVSNSSREQRSAIQSQVQRGRSRKRKSKNKKPAQSGTEVAIVSVSPASSSTTNPLLMERPKELYDAATRAIAAPIDPFDTTAVQIDTTAHGLLRYYIHYYHPAQWPNEPFSRNKGPYSYKASVHRIVNTAVQDQLMMFCLLSAASSRIQHIDRLNFPSIAQKQDGYTSKAIQLMRERVAGGSEGDMHMLLQCMLFLGMYYVYGDDFEAGRVHLKASLALLEGMGGINGMRDRHLLEQILMSDLFLSCVNLEPGVCGWGYDPGPASVLGLQDSELRKACEEDEMMGSAFLAKSTDLVPQDLRELIEEIVETYQVKTRLQASALSTTRALQTGQWITRRNMAIRARLLHFETTDDRTHALRAVLIMWTLLAMNITGRLKTVKIMAAKLRGILRGLDALEWLGHEDIQLWILVIGHDCSPERSELAEWYFERIVSLEMVQSSILASQICGESLSEWLDNFQKRFLYHGLVQQPTMLRLAEKLLEMDVSEVLWGYGS